MTSDVHTVLVRAKGHLLNDGWCQNALHDDEGRHCALGAILAATGQRTFDVGSAGAAAAGNLRRSLSGDSVAYWNNARERTFDDIIAAFDRVILSTAPAETPTETPEKALV